MVFGFTPELISKCGMSIIHILFFKEEKFSFFSKKEKPTDEGQECCLQFHNCTFAVGLIFFFHPTPHLLFCCGAILKEILLPVSYFLLAKILTQNSPTSLQASQDYISFMQHSKNKNTQVENQLKKVSLLMYFQFLPIKSCSYVKLSLLVQFLAGKFKYLKSEKMKMRHFVPFLKHGTNAMRILIPKWSSIY